MQNGDDDVVGAGDGVYGTRPVNLEVTGSVDGKRKTWKEAAAASTHQPPPIEVSTRTRSPLRKEQSLLSKQARQAKAQQALKSQQRNTSKPNQDIEGTLRAAGRSQAQQQNQERSALRARKHSSNAMQPPEEWT